MQQLQSFSVLQNKAFAATITSRAGSEGGQPLHSQSQPQGLAEVQYGYKIRQPLSWEYVAVDEAVWVSSGSWERW